MDRLGQEKPGFAHAFVANDATADRCDGQHTLAQIAAAVAEEYEVPPEEAAADCREYIDGLVAEGLLEWREGR